jgi:hypothetical protein
MARKYIPVEESFRAWRKDSECVAAYDALEDEFAVSAADMPRKQIATAARAGKSLPSRDA